MRKLVLLGLGLALSLPAPAQAASVSRSYNYFSIGGSTLSEIEGELGRRGPKVASTGQRHPGSTSMTFTSKLTFERVPESCRIRSASVLVKAKVTLPHWKRSRKADEGTRFVWYTLAADIKRHEESHIGIAKNAARDIEKAVEKLGRFKTCEQAGDAASIASAKILARHDQEQARFDRVEAKTFETRLINLMKSRLARATASERPAQ